MSGMMRFVIVIVLSLACLAAVAGYVVDRTTWGWFQRDLDLRAQLAVAGIRREVASAWDGPPEGLLAILAEVTRDERILGTAACTPDGPVRAATQDFPAEISMSALAARLREQARPDKKEWPAWNDVLSISGGKVHVSAIPLSRADGPFGFIVLVHDLSFADRRGNLSRTMIYGGFALLAGAVSAVTLIASRLLWKTWSDELRSHLQGGPPPPRFQPLVRDVHDLIQRISSDREQEARGQRWTPERLRQTLQRSLQGERIILVANREPYIHQLLPDGGLAVQRPASGLVTAVEPVLRACSGVWIAHGSGTGDRQASDAAGRLKVPPGEESYTLRRIWLSEEEEKGYYYGFSNEGLWPLCHIAHTRPVFRAEDWRQYLKVNERFADAVQEEAETDDPVVLVQDYHFAIAPRMIRERLPRATILSFWHIPWPNSESFGICPWRSEILEGLLGSSILGFHTRFHCNNFLEAVDRFLEARIDRETISVAQHERTTLVRSYPISVEWPYREADGVPPVDECRRSVIEGLRLRPDALIGIGVDRLDYTKGIVERFLAVERLLERRPDLRGRFTFIQVAAPSRWAIESYRRTAENVQATARRIQERFGSEEYRPIVLLESHHDRPAILRFYRAANVCYVSSLHDGMNLVAKEFVAARSDGRGVLVLSQFTGAARDLPEALIVNPYDLEQAASALAAALEMPEAEIRLRMNAMRSFLAEFNVFRWAGRMLEDATRLRRRERLGTRIAWRPPSKA